MAVVGALSGCSESTAEISAKTKEGTEIVQDSRVEEIDSRSTVHDEFSSDVSSATFEEYTEDNFQEYIKFDMSEDEKDIFLGLLRTSDMKMEEVDSFEGEGVYHLFCYDEEGNIVLNIMTDKNGNLDIYVKSSGKTYHVESEEVKAYVNELAETHSEDVIKPAG